MSNFTGSCPHCNHDIGFDRLESIWRERDYPTIDLFDCDKCGEEIQMHVHSVPEFELEKAETKEEYQKRLKEMIERNKQ